jgi:hypothetical protein
MEAAIKGADLVLHHMVDLWTEGELRDSRAPNSIYNMATTSALLSSTWGLTPWELVCEIRYQAAAMLTEGETWTITHPNGTSLRGTVGKVAPHMLAKRRGPFPEGVFPSTPSIGAEGTVIFEGTGPHWARHIGIPCRFSAPVRIELQQGKVKEIRGGTEADTLRDFFKALAHHLGEDDAYDMRGFHGGAHPNAIVSEAECPDPLYRAFIEHHGAHSVHLHLGNSSRATAYPFNVHVSAEVNGATVTIGDKTIYEDGRLTAFEHPEVQKVAARYPNRPGLYGGW